MINRDEFQVSLSLKINLTSDIAEQSGSVAYEFGVNKVPTKAEMDTAIKEAIDMFNKQLSVDDARQTTMEDFGYASPDSLIWKFDEE